MAFNVDIDEADVAVLNQNLIKSKELFNNISRSLNTIANKSTNASRSIKPILKDVNKLNENKRQVENGISLLSEVNESAAIIHNNEYILNNPIEHIGLTKFIDTLKSSKAMFKDMKPRFKQFRGILVNFETLIDKSDLKLQSYFQNLINLPAMKLLENEQKVSEIGIIFKYFAEDPGYVSKVYVRQRLMLLLETIRPLEASTQPVERPHNVPYERGTNGINRFNNELIKAIKVEMDLIDKLGLDRHSILNGVLDRLISEIYLGQVLGNFQNFFAGATTLLLNDILILEVVENLLHFRKFLTNFGLQHQEFQLRVQAFIVKNLVIFKEYIKYAEGRFVGVSVFNDKNIPEIIVELVLKIRRISEFPLPLLLLIENYKLGDWMVVKPAVRFVGVYTSVIPNSGNDESAEYLLSSFFSDVIDGIMVNVEIGIKANTGENALKKSSQGFCLIKNLIMIETIINRLATLFECLGNLGLERLNKLKNRFLKLFLDDWNYASYIIIRDMTSIATSNAHSGGVASGSTTTSKGSTTHLTSKEKELIKDLFKNFNESFEEALRNYERFNITDANLRTFLGNEIKKLILNAYFKLYDKYGLSDFTKNKPKYVKYDKQSFEKLLNEKL